ncbi:MAG: uroporphyrinogen decarboxylase family protein, partial [Phycisphaerae bacterium]
MSVLDSALNHLQVNTGKMTPRERMIAALTHRVPDRIPGGGCGTTREMSATMQRFAAERGVDWGRFLGLIDDAIYAGLPYLGPTKEDKDLWGIQRKKQSYGSGEYDEIDVFPLADVEDLKVLADYPWPDPARHEFDALRPKILAANPQRQKAVVFGGAGNPFEIYCWMTGLEEGMINLLVNPDLVVAALDRITGFFEEKVRRTLLGCGDLVDVVFFADDLGSQTSLLMSRETYRSILQPFHRRLTACVRQHAPAALSMFHSDGAVFDIMPDVMDAGIQVLQAVQVEAEGMDPARLKQAY